MFLFYFRMHPSGIELGFVALLLQRANMGELHLPEGVTSAEPDEGDDFDE